MPWWRLSHKAIVSGASQVQKAAEEQMFPLQLPNTTYFLENPTYFPEK